MGSLRSLALLAHLSFASFAVVRKAPMRTPPPPAPAPAPAAAAAAAAAAPSELDRTRLSLCTGG